MKKTLIALAALFALATPALADQPILWTVTQVAFASDVPAGVAPGFLVFDDGDGPDVSSAEDVVRNRTTVWADTDGTSGVIYILNQDPCVTDPLSDVDSTKSVTVFYLESEGDNGPCPNNAIAVFNVYGGDTGNGTINTDHTSVSTSDLGENWNYAFVR